ncbi:replication/maintenance protein RepL [Limnobacter sp. MED105]|uniref:replication/maintenance protein RepL n=1 Tax=Limnobacter sp. MED105 TaxID=391597 RepID=UPI000156C256|nr:replication/maintenance protein RepL [Limnobacter sp. MED105]EDM82795.1 putative plasmid replication protein [Limnobacter sp. MED105]
MESTTRELSDVLENNLGFAADEKFDISIKDKRAKAGQEFALVFLENLSSVIDNLSKMEFKVLIAIVKICQFNNVYKVTHELISKSSGIERSNVTRSIKKLKEKGYILVDEETKTEFVNPNVFMKGSLHLFKGSNTYRKIKEGKINSGGLPQAF